MERRRFLALGSSVLVPLALAGCANPGTGEGEEGGGEGDGEGEEGGGEGEEGGGEGEEGGGEGEEEGRVEPASPAPNAS